MAEAQPPSNECATCQTKTSLIITCKSGQHTFCQHCVTICLESRTTVENAQAGLLQVKTELIHCPLVEACWSQLESCLVHDIVDQITETRKENIARKLRRTNSVIPCPNENCTFAFYQLEENSFQTLFILCPKCHQEYCLTCKNRLSPQGYFDHVCPVVIANDISGDSDAQVKLREVLTEAFSIRCPSNQCNAPDRVGKLAVKEPGDCNAIKCDRCLRFFCFICSTNLGTKRQEAHNAFPHRNTNMEDAPRCWLFDDAEQGKTKERSLQIRQVIAVTNYMSALGMSDERRETVLDQHRELLGQDIFTYLTKRNPLKKGDKKCALM